jgi:VWFA-related protein
MALDSPGQEAPQATFEDAVEVKIFNFEVIVEDQDGQRVQGLAAKDLRLLIDGEETAIEFFSEIHQGQAEASDGLLPEPLAASGGNADGGSAIPVHYLVFVDELFSPVQRRNKALRRMSEELQMLRRGDRMAVVAFDGSRAKVLSPWSADRGSLQKLFADASRQKASLLGKGAGALTSELKYAKAERAGSFYAGGDKGDPGSAALVEAERQIRRDDVNAMGRSIKAATDALYALGDVSGRKVLILLSSGWPADIEGSGSSLAGGKHLWSLVDSANALGFSLYPVQMGQARVAGRAGDGAGQRQATGGEAERALHALAAQTGGRMLKTGQASYLERISQEASSFYWLGISDHQANGARREIKVEVLRPGLHARSRQSFVHLPLSEIESRRVAAVQRSGLQVQPVGGLQVEVGAISSAGRKRMDVPLTLKFPLQGITLLPHEGGVVATLDLRLTSLDSTGRDAEMPVIPLQLPFAGTPPAGQQVTYDLIVRLRKQPQTLRLILHDRAGDAVLSTSLPIEP